LDGPSWHIPIKTSTDAVVSLRLSGVHSPFNRENDLSTAAVDDGISNKSKCHIFEELDPLSSL
jgi:hypothetical protein